MFTLSDSMKARLTRLAAEIVFNRPFARALSKDKLADSFPGWKADTAALHLAVSDLAVSVRLDGTAPAEKKTAVFDAWRAVLADLTEKGADPFKPAAEDIPALLTMAGKYAAVSSDEYKAAAAESRAAKKALSEYVTANGTTAPDGEFAPRAAVPGTPYADRLAELTTAADDAKKALESRAAIDWEHYREFVPYSESAFRKSLEDFIADRVLTRRTKTAAEINAERKARRAENTRRRRAERAREKALAAAAAHDEFESKESEDRNRAAREDAAREVYAETVLKGVRDSAARVNESAEDAAAAEDAANDRADAREVYESEEMTAADALALAVSYDTAAQNAERTNRPALAEHKRERAAALRAYAETAEN